MKRYDNRVVLLCFNKKKNCFVITFVAVVAVVTVLCRLYTLAAIFTLTALYNQRMTGTCQFVIMSDHSKLDR